MQYRKTRTRRLVGAVREPPLHRWSLPTLRQGWERSAVRAGGMCEFCATAKKVCQTKNSLPRKAHQTPKGFPTFFVSRYFMCWLYLWKHKRWIKYVSIFCIVSVLLWFWAMIILSAKAIEIKSFSVTLNITPYALRLTEYAIHNTEYAIRNMQYVIRNTKYGICVIFVVAEMMTNAWFCGVIWRLMRRNNGEMKVGGNES